MILLAVDPGETTGWAMWSTDGESAFQAGEEPFMRFLDLVNPHIIAGWHVVCERFVINQGTVRKTRGDVNWSIETIGALRWMCQHKRAEFELQNASDAKDFASNYVLRKIGWWFVGGAGHANDAARHLLLLVARRYPHLLPSGVIPP